jgi:hypothetical protein
MHGERDRLSDCKCEESMSGWMDEKLMSRVKRNVVQIAF